MTCLKIFIGPMKAEKSTQLIRFFNKYNKFYKCIIVNSCLDDRAANFITTHTGAQLACIKVAHLRELEHIPAFHDAEYVLIDEAQFFPDLCEHVLQHISTKSYVIASLDADSQQQKFGSVWDLIPYADYVKKLNALCDVCADGTPAIATIGDNVAQITTDTTAVYKSVCRKHIYN